MSYKVIYPFYDVTDSDHVYNVGDDYPRAGSKPEEERIKELAGDYNKLQRPLIKEEKVEEVSQDEEEKVEEVSQDEEEKVEEVKEEPAKKAPAKKAPVKK